MNVWSSLRYRTNATGLLLLTSVGLLLALLAARTDSGRAGGQKNFPQIAIVGKWSRNIFLRFVGR